MSEETQNQPPVVDTSGEPSSPLETVTEGERLDVETKVEETEVEKTEVLQDGEEAEGGVTEEKGEKKEVVSEKVKLELGSEPHPLASGWTLYFSNTGITKDPAAHSRKSSAASTPNPNDSTADLYSHGLTPLFTSKTIEDLFGSWKALRRGVATMTGNEAKVEKEGEKIEPGDEGLGLRALVQDSNFHFFKEGVRPMWEDKMCAKGGKLTIPCNRQVIDTLFFNLVLLLAGGTLEQACPPPPPTAQQEGKIVNIVCGVVANRRARGDRIEVWLGGETSPDMSWVVQVRDHIIRELGVDVNKWRSF